MHRNSSPFPKRPQWGVAAWGRIGVQGGERLKQLPGTGVGLGGESQLHFHPVGSKVANCDKGAGVRMGGDMEGGGFLH